jgi:hypothetical protein
MDITKFVISDTKYLKTNPEPVGKNDCEVCAHCDIDHVDEKENISIRFGYEFTSTFCYQIAEYGNIQKLIQGKMQLDDSIAQNLGIEWNKFFEGIIKDTDVDI